MRGAIDELERQGQLDLGGLNCRAGEGSSRLLTRNFSSNHESTSTERRGRARVFVAAIAELREIARAMPSDAGPVPAIFQLVKSMRLVESMCARLLVHGAALSRVSP